MVHSPIVPVGLVDTAHALENKTTMLAFSLEEAGPYRIPRIRELKGALWHICPVGAGLHLARLEPARGAYIGLDDVTGRLRGDG